MRAATATRRGATGTGAYQWREFGADLAAVARALAAEIGGRIALGLGHSFGGTSMLLAAAEEPALFERLVLVDPVLHAPRAAESWDPERLARAGSLVERASRRRAVFPDRAAARENWRDKELFARLGSARVRPLPRGGHGRPPRRPGRAQVRARDRGGGLRRGPDHRRHGTASRRSLRRRSCSGRATATSRAACSRTTRRAWRTRASRTSTRGTSCRWKQPEIVIDAVLAFTARVPGVRPRPDSRARSSPSSPPPSTRRA